MHKKQPETATASPTPYIDWLMNPSKCKKSNCAEGIRIPMSNAAPINTLSNNPAMGQAAISF